jgi:CBS domain containing-hemolysin-like protein
MDDYRETIWGIDPKDRQWFQLLTLIGGTAGSVILTQLEISHGSVAPNQAARNILLGIGASFVASGFIAWGLLQAKELIMAIADWIRQDTARRRERQERLIQQAIQQGYEQGYADAQQGKPKHPPGDDPGKSN